MTEYQYPRLLGNCSICDIELIEFTNHTLIYDYNMHLKDQTQWIHFTGDWTSDHKPIYTCYVECRKKYYSKKRAKR